MNRRKFFRLIASALTLAKLPPLPVAAAQDEPGGPTPNDLFYVTTYSRSPRLDAHTWQLHITGLVEHPLSLTYSEIRALPTLREEMTLECIENPPNGSRIGNALWTGVRLRPLLERAQIKDKAVYAILRAADGYSTGIALDEIMRQENFLAYGMNGASLPVQHGYPLRVFVPGKFGMKQPKWLTGIELTDRPYLGYWESRGWSNSAWRRLNSGFFYPPSPANLSLVELVTSVHRVRTPVELVGWAINGPAGVREVQVSTDGGSTWHRATIVRNVSPYVWTVWKYRFAPARRGEYQVRLKAIAGDGAAQPPVQSSPLGPLAQARLTLQAI
jgi:DMSO/TMAO reductase YedYZ molybdopterin-dependent catalytic subunit